MLSVRCDGRIGASRAAESIRATTFLRPVAQEKEQWQPSRARLALKSDERVRRAKCSQEIAKGSGIGAPPLFSPPSDLWSASIRNAFLRGQTGHFDERCFRLDRDRTQGLTSDFRVRSSAFEAWYKEYINRGNGRRYILANDFYRNLDLGYANVRGEAGNRANFIFSLINSMSLSVGAAKTGIKRREACIISDARASLPTIYLLIARKLDFELLLSIRFGRLYLKDFPTKCEYLFFHRERIITQNTANSFATLSQRDVLRRTIGTKEKLNTKKCIKREEKISIDVITHLSWNPRKERISKGKTLFTCY